MGKRKRDFNTEVAEGGTQRGNEGGRKGKNNAEYP
jgi:hypothetical protein